MQTVYLMMKSKKGFLTNNHYQYMSLVVVLGFPILICWILYPAIDQRRHYAMRLELTEYGIMWRRPKYVPSWQPEKSGDLEGVKEPELSTPNLKVQPAKDVLDQWVIGIVSCYSLILFWLSMQVLCKYFCHLFVSWCYYGWLFFSNF